MHWTLWVIASLLGFILLVEVVFWFADELALLLFTREPTGEWAARFARTGYASYAAGLLATNPIADSYGVLRVGWLPKLLGANATTTGYVVIVSPEAAELAIAIGYAEWWRKLIAHEALHVKQRQEQGRLYMHNHVMEIIRTRGDRSKNRYEVPAEKVERETV